MATLRVDTDVSFNSVTCEKFHMRISYAVPFAKTKNTADKQSRERSNNIRAAFQSPFYLFVLASTSVGQEGLGMEWIERIVPHYPGSIDLHRYKRLINVPYLYRLTMGQPRQEELLEMIGNQHLTAAQISEMLFNLSPIAVNRRL